MGALEAGQKAGDLLNSGTTGIITVLCVVIVVLVGAVVGLYRKNDALNATMREALDGFRDEYKETIKGSTSAVDKLTISLASAVSKTDERYETMKALHENGLKTAQMVAGNAAALAGLETNLRADLRQALGLRGRE